MDFSLQKYIFFNIKILFDIFYDCFITLPNVVIVADASLRCEQRDAGKRRPLHKGRDRTGHALL